MRSPLATVAAAALVLTAAPAAATTGPPLLRTERVHFTCADGERAQDNKAYNGRFSSWSTVPPGASRSSGAGCIDVDPSQETQGTNGPGSPVYDVQWSGVAAGNLDSIAFEGYAWVAGAASPATALKYSLAVDGEPVHSSPWVPANPIVTSVSPVLYKIVFTVRGLGLLSEPDEGSQVRAVDLRLDLPDAISSTGSQAALWEWGNSDAPAGLTFNPPAG